MRLENMLAVLAGLSLALLTAIPAFAEPAKLPQRQFFQISTGSSAGSFFLAGQKIAGIVSHPPGLNRCESSGACGPAGLIVSTRTSDGSVANVLAVNAGLSDSGLAQINILADAVAGRGRFLKAGRQSHVRAISSLFDEPMHLVARRGAGIADRSQLAGKRVSLGPGGSGTAAAAREILRAYRIRPSRLKVFAYDFDRDAALLLQGKLDAFFYIGAAPSSLIADLLKRQAAVLIPLSGAGRTRLLRRLPHFAATAIPATAYGTGSVATVGTRAVWVVGDAVPERIVYGLLGSLYHPANRAALAKAGVPASQILLKDALKGKPMPLHPGAVRFYRDRGLIKN
jgi:TRAP transporter TAXI family solute receptor